jgi:protein-tyrosine phosphatase
VGVLVLFVCTANICRSPMAAALFARRTEGHVDRPRVESVGLGDAGYPPPDEVLEVMARRGIDLSGHRSVTLTAPLVAEAGLVVGMSLRHVQEAMLLVPEAWQRTFRLKELVRRGEYVGPRLPGQDIASWVRAAQGDRRRDSLANHSPGEDVADPYGGPFAGYEATADDLDDLTGRLAGLIWPTR